MVRHVHSPSIGSSGVCRLRIFLPQCHLGLFQPSSLDFFTPWLHSITRNRQGTLARSEYPQLLGKLASQDMGPVLTILALLAHRAKLHSSVPRLTRHGTRVNHACPSRLPFTLDVELGQETLTWRPCYPSSTHVATSLVARISVVHQSPKPKQHMLGSIELQSPHFW